MRIVIAVLLMLFVASCSHTRTFEEAYAEGFYMESINLLAADIEEKGSARFKQNDASQLRDLVNKVMLKYETDLSNYKSTDYDNRIEAYGKLLEMSRRLSNRFYSQEVSFFLDKYTSSKLQENIAKIYYEEGNLIVGNNGESYKSKAVFYRKGFEVYNYKDIEKLYKLYKTKYMQTTARELYDAGKLYAKQGDYQLAAILFENVIRVYKPLGKYKDSEKLARYYNKLERTNSAKEMYSNAEKIASSNSSHSQYRKAAEEYSSAAKVYRPYGQYRDAESKASDYMRKGKVRVYCRSSECESILSSVIRQYNYAELDSNADVYIDVSSSVDYSDRDGSVTNDSKTERDQTFNVKTETLKNKLTLTTDIRVSGLMSYSNSFKIEKTSSQINYSYSGDVPSGYYDHSEGNLKDQYQLSNEARSEQESELRNEFSRIFSEIERL
ncbi:hypothetical protein A9G11_00015 [Gilliamella sp. wkB108]|uniref:hypothetical protein n=1 Tax=Gilliamella sp. wkB108 TaxID=3120256 RepID=UPI00080E6E74|nr:hypothetical protein [Gilliamella apicola]OCG26189.1 hypothetical protein A9G11_00015 [Gilliamella apicola]